MEEGGSEFGWGGCKLEKRKQNLNHMRGTREDWAEGSEARFIFRGGEILAGMEYLC